MMTARLWSRAGILGFSLVEALVALALMGFVLGALATVTAQWLPNWNRGFARVQRAELLDVVVRRAAADISAAEFVSPDRKSRGPLFDGDSAGLTFVRSAVGPNTGPGLEIVRIGETADRQGTVAVRMRAPYAPSAGEQPQFSDAVVLLRAPYRMSFAYAGTDGRWTDEWHNADRLPRTVRVAIRDAASDRALAISTVATIRVELPAACAGADGGDVCGKAEKRSATADASVVDGESSRGRQ